LRLHRLVRARPRHAVLGAFVIAGTLSASPLVEAQPALSSSAHRHAGHGGRHHGPHARRPSHRPRREAVHWRLVVARHRYDVRAGAAVRVRGTLLPRSRGRRVVVEAGAGHGRWLTLAVTRTRANGHFAARIAGAHLGALRLRVRVAGGRRHHLPHVPAGTLLGYRPTLASWYALYGGALACGGTLGYNTLGVANRTLPCGTRVTLRYRGRRVTVRVIDRGPYVGGREWDLTGATARRLGFEGVGVVWSTQ
jgi:peptidoglycan lytic transglycosylase